MFLFGYFYKEEGCVCGLSEYAAGAMHSLFLFLHHHAPTLHLIHEVVLRLLYNIVLLPTLNQVDGGYRLAFGYVITESDLPTFSGACIY